jgi:abequosyltransferase
MKPLLSICIPTLDRAELLERVLSSLSLVVRNYPVEVCISDNASTDNTVDIIQKMAGGFEDFKSARLTSRSVYASNLLSAVKLSTADFVWVLPDYAHVDVKTLNKILNLLKVGPVDAIFMNVGDRIHDKSDLDLISTADAFDLFGWHSTLLGSAVVQRSAYLMGVEKFAESDFIQFLACFTHLAEIKGSTESAKIYWLGENAWYADAAKKTAWGDRALTVWMKRWRDACLSMSYAFSEAECKKVLRSHQNKSGMFSFSALCAFRANRGCSLRELWALRECWFDTGLFCVFKAALVGLLPSSFFRLLRTCRRSLQ